MNCARAIAAVAVCLCLTAGLALGQIIDEVDTASGKSGSWTRPPGGSSSKTGGGWNRVPSSGSGGSNYIPATGRPNAGYVPATGTTQQAAKATVKPNTPPKRNTGVAANPTPRRTLAANDPPEQVVIGPAGLVVDQEDVIDENEKAKPPIDVTGGDVGPDSGGSDPTPVPSAKDDEPSSAQQITEEAVAAALAKAEAASAAANSEAAEAPATSPTAGEAAPQLGQEAAEPLGQEAAEPLGQEAADPTTADSVVIPPTGGNANAGVSTKPTWTRPPTSGNGPSAGTRPASGNPGGSASAASSPSVAPKDEFVDENERAARPQYGVGGLLVVPNKSNGKPSPLAERSDIEPEDTPARPPLNSGDPRTEAKATERIRKQFAEEMVLEGEWQDEQGADFFKRHGPRPFDAEGAASWDKAREREIRAWGRQRKLEELRRQRKQ